MAFNKNQVKTYGLGLGLRKEIRSSILDFYRADPENDLIQWLEIVPENYILRGGRNMDNFAEVLKEGISVIPHGVDLSVGTAPKEKGANPFDKNLLVPLKELFNEIKPPWFSDHISCARIDDVYMNELLPVPFINDAVEVVADNVKYLQDEFQLPFLIENPSYYTTIIEPEMKEFEFINKIMEKADCGMLLDVNNVYVNSVNHNYDAEEFLNNLDLDRVVQLHIAGHKNDYKCISSGRMVKILDTHGAEICQEVYDLLDSLLQKTTVNAILLERDFNFPDFDSLLGELKTIREIMNKNTKVKSNV